MSDLPPELQTACKTGDLALAKSQYEALTTSTPSSKHSLLSQMSILAATHSHPSLLTFCFSQGLTLDPSKVNDPLLYAACDSSSVEVFKVLLDNGADANQYLELGGSPLVSACKAGNLSPAKFLLDRGADPNCGYALGDYEALVWAIVGPSASLDVVRLLLERGAVVKGSGALIAATESDVDVEEVEEYGAYYDKEKEAGLGTALYAAAKGGREEIVHVLFGKGANVHFRTKTGVSPAEIAERNGHADIARILRQREAN
ncbi:hypothetical protein G7Y79_00146g102150 [Physcia stellaris]|nr:hypothetical protein G7Y79_00146g102150 [Physcia stellaris]